MHQHQYWYQSDTDSESWIRYWWEWVDLALDNIILIKHNRVHFYLCIHLLYFVFKG